MTAAMKAYNNIDDRWKDNMRFLEAATQLAHTDCIAWQKEDLDGLLEARLGYKPSTISCLVELTLYRDSTAWFKAR